MPAYECPTCGREDFAREVDMKAHHTLVHGQSLVGQPDPRECPLCGDSFASEAGMKAHHALIHAESIAESRQIGRSTREVVIDRDEQRCQRCGIDVTPSDQPGADFQLHHLIPRAAGGPNHPANLVTLCNACHAKAHRRIGEVVDERPAILEELRDMVCAQE